MAVTINNNWGAETGGMDEASSVVSATASSAQAHSGAYSYLCASSAQNFDLDPFEAVADAGTKCILGFWYRTPSAFSTLEMAKLWDGTNQDFSLDQQSDGAVDLQDSAGITRINGTTLLSASTWYFIEVYVDRLNSGAAEFFIDGVSQGTTAAQDFNAITGGPVLRFAGTHASASTYYDDIYFISGATAATDRLGGCEVFGYRSNLNSATPDIGDVLDIGVWKDAQEIPFSTTLYARYEGAGIQAGAVNTDDLGGSSTGGPSGDTKITGSIKAIKGIWNARRSSGTATTHYALLGNSGDGTTRTTVVLGTTNKIYTVVSEAATIVPTAAEYCRIGIEKTAGSRKWDCRDMLATILHVPANDFTLTAASGSYSVTGQSAGLDFGTIIKPVSGSYAVTGQSAALTVTRGLTASSGTYAITGAAANLLTGRDLSAVAGSYLLTAQAVGLTTHRDLPATLGNYAVTGQASNLDLFRNLGAATGAYALPGASAGLDRGLILQLNVGSYSISGQAANVKHNAILQPATGAYTKSGVNAALRFAQVLSVGAGIHNLSGASAALSRGYSLQAAPGSFSLIGVAAALDHGYQLGASTGSHSSTGQPAALQTARQLSSVTGSYALTGNSAGLLPAQVLAVNPGVYAITGVAADLQTGGKLSADTGVYAVSGQSSGLQYERRFTVATSAIALAGTSAILQRGYLLVGSAGNYVQTGQSASLSRVYVLVCDTGSVTYSGVNAELDHSGSLAAETGTYTITGVSAKLPVSRQIAADFGEYSLTGLDTALLVNVVPVTPSTRTFNTGAGDTFATINDNRLFNTSTNATRFNV